MRLPFDLEIREQDVATIVNLLFGMLAILFLAVANDIGIAAVFVLVCVLADGADGYLARTRGQGSLGFQLDSLADFVSFGLVPSILVYYAVRDAVGYRFLFFLIFVLSFLYLVGGMLRLARYNVAPQEAAFSGLPITAAGMIVALYVLVGFPVGLLAVALVLAGLMVSDIQYPKVRNTITLAVVGALLLLILLLYAIGTSYWIISAVLLLLSIVYVLNPLYRRYFR